MPLERKDWVGIKRKYLHSDRTHQDLATEYGISRQGVIGGLKREFPKVDWKVRKAEEKLKRDALVVSKSHEKGEIARLQLEGKVDATDEKHLDLINLLLDNALEECENGTLKAKSIRDIIDLMNMHRTIHDKRTTNDTVITIRAEKPDDIEQLPEIVEAECEVLE